MSEGLALRAEEDERDETVSVHVPLDRDLTPSEVEDLVAATESAMQDAWAAYLDATTGRELIEGTATDSAGLLQEEPPESPAKCAHCHRPPHVWQHVLAPSAARYLVIAAYRGVRGVRRSRGWAK